MRRSRSGPDWFDDVHLEGRFQSLVQSPLRAGLVRFLHARANESFDVEALMQTFGRMRQDIENCLREMADSGVTRRVPGAPPRYTASWPTSDSVRHLLDQFPERRATVSHEDRSPSVQRFREMIGRDEKMLVIFEWIRTAAKSDISVLMLGPTGTGKEVVARMIHELSRRSAGRFQAVNCAALPDTLFESELFGYEKGAFTGAHDRKPGRIELAKDGTLFLDEIGDLSMVAQAKLLRVLEERRIERLGGQQSIDVNFRLISRRPTVPSTSSCATAVSVKTSTTGSTPFRSGCRPCGSAPPTFSSWHSACSPRTVPRMVCRSTAKSSSRPPWIS